MALVALASMVAGRFTRGAAGWWWSEVSACSRSVFLCRMRLARCLTSTVNVRRLRVNNLKSRLTRLESKHSLRPRATHSGTRRAPQQAPLGLSRRAGANAHQTQKPRAGCPARTPADATAANAAPAGRLDSGTRRPAGLPAGSCPSPNKQPKKLFETLAARPDAASLAQAAQKGSDHCGA